jgi:hypothetical protein
MSGRSDRHIEESKKTISQSDSLPVSQPQPNKAEKTVVNEKENAEPCLETMLCVVPSATTGYIVKDIVAPAIGLGPAASCVAGTLAAGGIANGLRPTFFGGRTRQQMQDDVTKRLAAQDAASFRGQPGPRTQTMEDSKPAQKNKPVQQEENLAVKKTK